MVSAVMILAPDDEPMEGVIEQLRDQCEEIIFVRGRQRARQRNEGLTRAKYEYVLMIDRDQFLASNYVSKLCAKMDKDVGAVCGISFPHPDLDKLSKLEELTKLGILFNTKTITGGTLYNKNVALKVGGFRVKALLADLGDDLLLRMKENGFKVVFCEDAVLFHKNFYPFKRIILASLTCSTTKYCSLPRLFGRVLISPLTGVKMAKKVYHKTGDKLSLLISFYFLFRQLLFAISGLIRSIFLDGD